MVATHEGVRSLAWVQSVVTTSFVAKVCSYCTVTCHWCKIEAFSIYIPYSRKYWRSLNLAIWSRAAEIKILADLNLAVVPCIQYARTHKIIHIYVDRIKFDGFKSDGRFPNRQTAKFN